MTGPAVEVQRGIYQLLSAALSCPVYDHVPADATPPYVVLEREVSSARNALNARHDDRHLYLSVWSNYKGQAEVKSIMDTISNVAHGQRLALTSGKTTSISVTRTDTSRDADGVTYQGQVALRLITPR